MNDYTPTTEGVPEGEERPMSDRDIWPYVRLAARPTQERLGMTRVGVLRDEYNATMEGHPPRWIMTPYGYVSNGAYFAWAKRADAWITEQGVNQ